METFALKPALFFGSDPLSALSSLSGKRVLIVTDAFLASSGLLGRVTAQLGSAQIYVFDQVAPDPSLQLVAQGIRALNEFRPDAVVAFGGGSPMDCAKAMCWFTQPHPPLWCIPTTAGTGSEVTSFAVLTDVDKGVKYPVKDNTLLPENAILDPSFLAGVPPTVTADTGIDVLTHAAEAAVALGATPFTDALAEKAFALAYEHLPKAFQGESGAKAQMLYASCLAGIAFNAAGLGVCHSISHSLGGRFHLPHGRLNGMLLPHVIRFNATDPRAAERYARLARLSGVAGNPRALAAALAHLRLGMKQPATLPIPAQEARAAIPDLAQIALKDACLASNPRPVTQGDVESLLREICG